MKTTSIAITKEIRVTLSAVYDEEESNDQGIFILFAMKIETNWTFTIFTCSCCSVDSILLYCYFFFVIAVFHLLSFILL